MHFITEFFTHVVSFVVVVEMAVHVFDARLEPIVIKLSKLLLFDQLGTRHLPLRVLPVEIPIPFGFQVSLFDFNVLHVLLPSFFV